MRTWTTYRLGIVVLLVGMVFVPMAFTQSRTGASSTRKPEDISETIDRIIDNKLKDAKVPASPAADDAEFIRRATLDITGRIPTASRVTAFLQSPEPNKRRMLVDELLDSPYYGENFAGLWYRRLIKLEDDNRFLVDESFQDWLAERLNKNQGWNKIVYDILMAQGARDKNPETVFYLAQVGADKPPQPEANKVASVVSRQFLGVQLQCCECHNHPFGKMKQTDFWGMAAFFTHVKAQNAAKKLVKDGAVPEIHEGGGLGRFDKKKLPDKLPPQVAEKIKAKMAEKQAPAGAIVIPDSGGKTVKARFLEGQEAGIVDPAKLRPTFAAWAVAAKNPYFANAAANRMWAHFFGKGIVDPVDDIRPESKPSHPDLLKLLAGELTASNFDLKHLVRCICNSKTYQRSSQVQPENKNDESLYSRMPVKVLSPDQMYDSLTVALGRAPGQAMEGKGNKLLKGGGPRARFRFVFNPSGEEAALDYNHGVPQALVLLNAPALTDGSGLITRLTKADSKPESVIEGLFLTAYARKPTEEEMKKMTTYVAETKDNTKGYHDVWWVLLNSSEFILNH